MARRYSGSALPDTAKWRVVLPNPDQLVLQFEATNIEDFDHLIWIEERLAEDLGRNVEIDGHDFGRGSSTSLFWRENQ
jgi:hypothetical protein